MGKHNKFKNVSGVFPENILEVSAAEYLNGVGVGLGDNVSYAGRDIVYTVEKISFKSVVLSANIPKPHRVVIANDAVTLIKGI